VLDCIHEHGFSGVPDFLDVFLFIPPKGDDPRSIRHMHSATSVLAGNDTFTPLHLAKRLLEHPSGQPKYSSARVSERELAFTPVAATETIHFARPAITSLSVQLVGERVHKELGRLAKSKVQEEETPMQLRAGTNGRARKTRVVAWDDIKGLNIGALGIWFKKEAPVAMYLLECMAAPRLEGKVVVRKRRPYHLVSHSLLYLFEDN
jgi:hypothetical protein